MTTSTTAIKSAAPKTAPSQDDENNGSHAQKEKLYLHQIRSQSGNRGLLLPVESPHHADPGKRGPAMLRNKITACIGSQPFRRGDPGLRLP
jgi:hypothetical protein